MFQMFFGDFIVNEKDLKIPHPDAHNRFFVLKPLSEIAPDYIHPVFMKSVKELLAELIRRD